MMPYTATDMIRSMDNAYDLVPKRRRSSLLRFITAVQSRFTR